MKMECQKDCTSMTKKHLTASITFFPFFFSLRMLLKGFLIKQPTAPKNNRMDFLMKSGTGFPHVTPPRQAVLFFSLSFFLRQVHSDVLVKTTQSPQPPPFARGQGTASASSCHNRPKKQSGGSPVLKHYKLILHMTEEKTAKVKPFLFKFLCVCV